MKKSFALLAGALPLAIVLAGCAQIEETVGNITGNHSWSKNLTVDGKVETSGGSYSTIKVGDAFMNANVYGGPDFVDIDNPETGEKMTIHPPHLRERISRYFFDEFIDSTALEGGEPTLTAWKAEKLAAGTFSAAPFTKQWLDGALEGGAPIAALTAEILAKDGGLAFIHDGKPRMTDANISFGEATWTKNDDGTIVKITSDWSVDYRVTDKTAVEMLKAQNKFSDDDVQQYLTDEVKDGAGENKLHISGTAEWYLQSPAGDLTNDPLYLINATYKRTLEPFVKPEFHTPAPTAPAAP